MPAVAPHGGSGAWRVLIVDDDADVHSTTTFALGALEIHGRPLEFLHAYSAAETMALLDREQDIAVILLDVIMEQADAGLHLVRHVRDTLGRHDVRIILRTGQPGYAPEMDAIRGYDINDYRTKSELTRTKLYTSVAAAIRAYQQIHALEDSRTGLAEIVRANTELMALHSIGEMTLGILRETAALAGQPADGLLCACPPGGAKGWQVLASCGASADLARDGMLAAGTTGPAAAIAQALAERRNLVRERARIDQPDHPAHRMAYDRHLLRRRAAHQTRQVVHIFGQRIAAAPGPVGIAMAAQVGGQHMKMRLQRPGDQVEAAAMIAAAMDQQHRRRIRVAPVPIMQPQPLRLVEAAFRTGHCQLLASEVATSANAPAKRSMTFVATASGPRSRGLWNRSLFPMMEM